MRGIYELLVQFAITLELEASYLTSGCQKLMHHHLTAFIVFLLTLILPLQGVAAVAMPISCYSSTTADMQKGMEEHKAMKETVSLEAHGKNSEYCESPCDQHKHDGQVQDCYVCHIFTMQAPATLALILVPDTALRYPPVISSPYPTFVSSLFRPPKLLLA